MSSQGADEQQVFDRLLQEVFDLRQQVKKSEDQLTASTEPSLQLSPALIELSSEIYNPQPVTSFLERATEVLRALIQVDRIAVYRFNPDDTGEFVAESRGEQWRSLIHLQREKPEIKKNISDCALKYLQLPNRDLSRVTHPSSHQSKLKLFRICHDVQSSGFSDCYLNVLNLYQAQAYAIAPLYDDAKLWGLLAAYHNAAPHQWQQHELQYLLQVAIYCEGAIKQNNLQTSYSDQEKRIRQQLTQQIQTQQNQLRLEKRQQQALGEVINTIRRSIHLDDIFQAAVRETRRLLQADRVIIYRFQPETDYEIGTVVAEDVGDDFPSALEVQVTDRCFAEEHRTQYVFGHISQINDIFKANLSDCHRDFLLQFQIRAHLIVPIFCNDNLWGLLCIHQCQSPRAWQLCDRQFIQKIAVQLGVGLQQAELYKQAQQQTTELQIALQQVEAQREQQTRLARQEKRMRVITERIRETLDLETTFQVATTEILDLVDCDRAAIYQFNADWSGEFIAEAYQKGNQPLIVKGIRTAWRDDHLQETQGGRYANHETYVVSDIYKNNHRECHIQILESLSIKAYVIVPIFVGAKLWGLLATYQHQGTRQWSDWEVTLLKRLGDQLGVVIQQGELFAQLRLTTKKAEAANEAKSLFLANMSHELRTPLNAILGFTQVLSRQNNLSPTQTDHLGIISRAGNHLLLLLNDVLTMSKIEANQIKLNTEYFEMGDVVATLQDIFQLQAQTKQLSFQVEVDPQIPRCLFGDRGKLQQVVINLLSNAFKFTTVGKIHLKFWSDNVSSAEKSDPSLLRLYCQVRDTGIGIAPEELEPLFAPFIQTSAGKQVQEGTGLGLSISKHFVELMGGEIHVKSQVGQGSCFQFSVQLQTEPQHGYDVTSETAAIAPSPEKKRILVVHSETSNVPSWHDFIREQVEIRQAIDRETIVSLVHHWQPHLIVIDQESITIDIATLVPEILAAPFFLMPCVVVASERPLSNTEKAHLSSLGCNGFVTNSLADPKILPILMEHLGVQYTSIKASQNSSAPEVSQAPNKPTSQAYIYSVLPQTDPAWRQELRAAAIAARENTLRQLVTEISDTYPALSQHLHHHLNHLAFDTIVKLIDDIKS